MYTDALWSTMFSIALLLAMTVFVKLVFFRWFYGVGTLTTLQVAVDWRLWTMDWWFWFILGSLVLLSLVLNLTSRCLEQGCENRRHKQEREHRQKLARLNRLDLSDNV